MTTKHLYILVAAVLAALSLFSSSAYARNEFVNGVFKEGRQIDPIQGDLGVANYRMIVPHGDPRAGEHQYFEKCWDAPGGFNCKYEVLFNGRTSPGRQTQQAHVNSDNADTGDRDFYDANSGWSGTFDVQQNGDGTFTARKNGEVIGMFKVCKDGDGHAGAGSYCEDESYFE